MNLREILKATHGMIISGERQNKEVGKLCIDSRILEKGDIFVAIRGEKTNGNKYIDDVIDKASAIITDRFIISNSKTPIIKVFNVKKAITNIGKYNRKKYIDKPLIAITGSVGKTTTKELTAEIFETKYNILKTEGNQNNELGVPLTLSKINDKHDIIILELGMDHLKEIEKLSRICKPSTAIITNIGTSHIGNLKTQENILKAKMEITKYLKKGDLIVNGSDFYLSKLKQTNKYGIIKTNNEIVENIKIDDKLHFDINIEEKEYNVEFNIPNKYLIENILLAIEAAKIYQIPPHNIIKAINNFEGAKGRLENIELNNNITLISDCYNASPESIKSSLSVLDTTKKKKMAIIGDVLELGTHSEELHKKIGESLEEIKDLRVLTVGEATKIINIGKHFNNNEELKDYLKRAKIDDTTILIKGSHGMNLEEIKDYLIEKYKAQ
jgi:UDP-N-acetylmuramoyl-tripeptide--D-alanyl-D-alanine ligase